MLVQVPGDHVIQMQFFFPPPNSRQGSLLNQNNVPCWKSTDCHYLWVCVCVEYNDRDCHVVFALFGARCNSIIYGVEFSRRQTMKFVK